MVRWYFPNIVVVFDRVFAQKKYANRPRPEIIIMYGPSGTGKTSTVRTAFPKAYWLAKPSKNGVLWFDNYDGERTIVVDEYFGWISYTDIKRMLDYGYMRVQVKQGFVWLLANRWVFTSNKPPRDWYKRDIEGAFERRIREFATIYFVGGDGRWVEQSYGSLDTRYYQSHLTANTIGGIEYAIV